MKVFIDTSAFFAAADKNDKYHLKAAIIVQKLADEKAELFTSNFVLSESLTLLKKNLGHEKAMDFICIVKQSMKIIRLSEIEEEKALQVFNKYRDKNFSFVDCTSFVVVKEYRIDKSFTFDKHFNQFGLDVIS